MSSVGVKKDRPKPDSIFTTTQRLSTAQREHIYHIPDRNCEKILHSASLRSKSKTILTKKLQVRDYSVGRSFTCLNNDAASSRESHDRLLVLEMP